MYYFIIPGMNYHYYQLRKAYYLVPEAYSYITVRLNEISEKYDTFSMPILEIFID